MLVIDGKEKIQRGAFTFQDTFKIVATDEPLSARSGLLLPHEMAKALRLPKVINKKLPRPGSGRIYRVSRGVFYG